MDSKAPKTIHRGSRSQGGLVGWGKQIWGEFTSRHGDLAAAAVALFGLLSVVPVILLAVWLFVQFVAKSPEQAWQMMYPHMTQLLAGSSGGGATNPLLDAVHGVIQNSSAAGLVGAIGFAWAGSRIFNILAEALNEIWEIGHNRGFVKQNLLSLAMLLALGAIFLVSVGLAGAKHYSVQFLSQWVPGAMARILGPVSTVLLNVLTAVALFAVIYWWVPNRRVRWQAALFGGALGGIVWAAFQQAFRFYMGHFASYNKIYGTMGAFVALVLWAYYSAYILLLGGAASAVFSERVYGARGEDETTDRGSVIKRLRGEVMSRS